MDYCVFIQTNHKQITGAIVAEYALRRYSLNNDKFQVRIVEKRNYPYFDQREGHLRRQRRLGPAVARHAG
jgi:hypothetical protein